MIHPKNEKDPRTSGAAPVDPGLASLVREKPTQSNSLDIPEITLPRGGGALRGIDEQFEVNAANGTATLTLPLPLTAGRNGFTPQLALRYNSGAGNGPFGLGWSLDLPSIQRRTDRRLPRYQGEDTFQLAGADDLVPSLQETGPGQWQPVVSQVGDYQVQRFRPRLEGAFARIERIRHPALGVYWRVTSAENVTTLYGRRPDCRLADPDDPTRIFRWLPELSFDDRGNWIQYAYRLDSNGIEEQRQALPGSLSERQRRSGQARFAQQYLKRIRYGNRTPYFPVTDAPYDPTPPAGGHFFELVFDYGEHDEAEPTPEQAEGRFWGLRADPFSDFRAGFDIRTYRLCRRILLFHRFPELGEAPCLVRSLELTYGAGSGEPPAGVTYLLAATSCGFRRRPDGTYSRKKLPPVEFDYEPLQWQTDLRAVDRDSIVHAPAGLSGAYQWIDLYGEGISGMLTEQAEGWYYKENLGDAESGGQVRFAEARLIAPRPALSGLQNPALQLVDLEADGHRQLVVRQSGLHGFFDRDETGGWLPFQSFEQQANIDLRDPRVRLIDLNGDGQPELVVAEENVFVWYTAAGKKGFLAPEFSPRFFDEERSPTVVFADEEQSIFLADMTGDGLTDIVRIRNGEICYWPNRGYGRFAPRVSMENAPLFDRPDLFHPRYLHLADISGTGPADLLYLGRDRFRAFLNHSGNGWSEAQEIDPFFPVDDHSRITVTDLLGNGTSCIVWSSDLPGHSDAPLRYIDLMGSKKPHLLRRVSNNFGKETALEYRSSTHFYLRDKREGRPWATRLPFPVQVVSKVIITERITGLRFATEYRYRHGYYDRAEREFRGFGLVEQYDTESYAAWRKNNEGTRIEAEEMFYQPPLLTRSWYHTGAFLDREHILSQYAADYWPEELRRQGFEMSAAEAGLPDAEVQAAQGVDPVNIERLSSREWREALRACKGMLLRREVFALDAPATGATPEERRRELTPFTVTSQNCLVQLLQPAGDGNPAVFFTTQRESLTYEYERQVDDPRRTHALNLAVDVFGNILEQVAVVYPRSVAEDDLPGGVAEAQQRMYLTFTRHTFTQEIITPTDYRLRQPAETRTFELLGFPAPAEIYRHADFGDILGPDVTEIEYQRPFQEDAGPLPGGPLRRLIEQTRQTYYDADLAGPLPPGLMTARGLPYESYQLAYTPSLLTYLFQGRVQPADLNEAFLIDLDADGRRWIRSGHVRYLGEGQTIADAAARFFSPLAYVDPFGALTRVRYYREADAYFLLLQEMEDALGSRMRAEAYDFFTLTPTRLRDANDNLSAVVLDELGMVKALALLGKDADGDGVVDAEAADVLTGQPDTTEPAETASENEFLVTTASDVLTARARALLQGATTRFVYDHLRYYHTRDLPAPQPAVSAVIRRERHHAQEATEGSSPLQISFSYSGGMGKELMTKTPAAPGLARQLTVQEDGSFLLVEVDTGAQLRWVGNGRTVLNNKGNPVRQFEPYFSVTPAYETDPELVETGVSPLFFYDAPGRLIRTLFPDGALARQAYSAWRQLQADRNDTVLESEWYAGLGSPDPDGPEPASGESRAAWLAAQHAQTPLTLHLDNRGRPVAGVAQLRDEEGADTFLSTLLEFDIEGNLRRVTDARGNVALRYDYDLLGHRAYQWSADAGERRQFAGVTGKPVKQWDNRGTMLHYFYDVLQRPTGIRATGGDGPQSLDHLYEKMTYGEGQPNDRLRNLRGKLVEQYDTGGRVQIERYDFKGNPLQSHRRLAADYKQTPDWSVADPAGLLEAGAPFTTETRYDALNRAIWVRRPDDSVTETGFDPGGRLTSVTVTREAVSQVFVQKIDYDAKGQRRRIRYGNDVATGYTYDARTFRLLHLETRKGNQELLQDLHYTYDPVGNVVQVEDKCIPPVFFGGQKIEAVHRYRYDALYRLTGAEGREHAAPLSPGAADNWQDLPFLVDLQPNDALAWRPYQETYRYDALGNILELRHQALGGPNPGAGSWTRAYTYAADNNRLLQTSAGGQVFTYEHHPDHGFLTRLPHLAYMNWNFREELQAIARQRRVDGGTPETTYYVYDTQGRRLRKVTENAADPGVTPGRKSECIYLDGIEIYREFRGNAVDLERRSLHVMDDTRRIALLERRVSGDDGSPTRLVRYQLGNHLGSACLETDDAADPRVISYEEYHPFGSTAYQARDADIRAAAKRFRFSGKERDEESGFYYHGARYYAPWLARWINVDPLVLGAGLPERGPKLSQSPYCYVGNRPLNAVDPDGLDDDDFTLGPLAYRPLYGRSATFSGAGGEGRAPFLLSPSGLVAGEPTQVTQSESVGLLGDRRLELRLPLTIDAAAAAREDPGTGRTEVGVESLFTFGQVGSGLFAAIHGRGRFELLPSQRLQLGDLPGALSQIGWEGLGEARFTGVLSGGGFNLATLRGRAIQGDRRLELNLDVESIGRLAELNLRGTAAYREGGVADVNATARLTLLGGLSSVRASGQGRVSTTGAYEFRGSFTGYVLPVSYATGSFRLSSTAGISADAHVFGLTYTPGISVRDPSPLPPAAVQLLHLPSAPEAPSGATIGYSYTRYAEGRFTHFSIGLIPSTSDVSVGAHLTLPFDVTQLFGARR